MTADPYMIASLGLFVAFAIGALRVLFDKNALRDDSSAVPKPYSLARVQLWFWTVVILGSWILTYGICHEIWALNGTCLTLLGISGLTTSAGRIIDNRDARDPGTAGPNPERSAGFFADILSDERGLSVHRFQLLSFNLMFGTAFLTDVFSKLDDGKFPSFDPQSLTLLGLSSGTYVAIKSMEKQSAAPASAPPAAEQTGAGASVDKPAAG